MNLEKIKRKYIKYIMPKVNIDGMSSEEFDTLYKALFRVAWSGVFFGVFATKLIELINL